MLNKKSAFLLLSISLSIIIFFVGLELLGSIFLKIYKFEMLGSVDFYQTEASIFSEKSDFNQLRPLSKELLPRQSPHPYFGYVMNRARDKRVNESGFISKISSPNAKSPNKISIGILGGSAANFFAQYLQNQGREEFEQLALNLWPKLKGYELEIHNLALPGGKQPQQFHIASHYAQFLNMTINLEGFNEVTFAPPELYPNNYPKHSRWFYPINFIRDYSNLRLGLSAWLLKSMSQEASSGFYLPRSRFYFFIFLKIKEQLYFELQEFESEKNSKYGGDRIYRDEELDEVLELWVEWTKKQEVVLRSYGVKSFFFIQSNPYVGKKELTEDEKRLALPPNSESELYKVRERYRALENKSASIGKNFCIHSLIGVFDLERRTVFVDPYSHVNELGNSIILKEILHRIKNCGAKLP